MSDIAIRVEGLGKQYRLGAQQAPYQTLGEQFRKWTSLRSLLRRQSRTEKNPPFWALKDVSFEVKKGEVVGIIGRNGAGKSTLLKILSQITEPTEGTVDLFGRVGSLLEVGTGFHPELTGRENIYLNGAILGMKRVEIARKFDEIVAFAEVEKFIDTAVKHYSSGMYMRLAFAVAAHLEPEILIVDEVLAVGDAEFQKKCLGKMGDVAKQGRTVLFVSHNISAINSLCNKGIYLDKGNFIKSGHVKDVTQDYMKSSDNNFQIHNSEKLIFISKAAIDHTGNEYQKKLQLSIDINSKIDALAALDIVISDNLGNPIGFSSFGTFNSLEQIKLTQGQKKIVLALDISRLANGAYYISLDITIPFVSFFDRAENCIFFKVDAPSSELNKIRMEQFWAKGCWHIDSCLVN